MFFMIYFRERLGALAMFLLGMEAKLFCSPYKKKFLAAYFTSSALQPLQFTASFFTWNEFLMKSSALVFYPKLLYSTHCSNFLYFFRKIKIH